MSKDAIFSTILKRSGDRLIYAKNPDEALYKTFVESLEEDHLVHVFFDASKDNGTLAQLAKIKVCIREIAKETGNTFEDTEIEIKKASGLCIVRTVDGERYMFCKSFGDCSASDLSLAIQTIIQKGDFLNMNLR